jgi:hypothetical protein
MSKRPSLKPPKQSRRHLKGLLRLVVARYDEDLSWLNRIDPLWHRTIVTKGQQLPNTGREASSYLWAMENVTYEDDGWVCFVQGNPFDHYDGLFEALNDPLEYPLQFLPLARGYAQTDATGKPHDHDVPVREFFEKFVGPWPTTDDGAIGFAPGAQFIVPAAYLRGHTKDELRELRAAVDEHEAGAHAMERIWEAWMKF